jgi:hypothetical protein
VIRIGSFKDFGFSKERNEDENIATINEKDVCHDDN